MRILAWIIPWTILLIITAVGITSWVWMNQQAQANATWQDYADRNAKAWQQSEAYQESIRATADAEIQDRNTRIASDRERILMTDAQLNKVIHESNAVIVQNERTIADQNRTIIRQKTNLATQNQTIREQQRQINLLRTPKPTYTPRPTYTPYPTATRRPWPTPRPTYTPHPTPTPITAFTLNHHQIRCQAAPEFSSSAGKPGIGDTVHIYTGVKIEVLGRGQGRGYVAHHNGHEWVVTAAHVVGYATRVLVEGKSFNVHSSHRSKDIAFIYIGKSPFASGSYWDSECIGRKSSGPIYHAKEHSSEYSWPSDPDECQISNTWFIRLTGGYDRSYAGNSGSPVLNTTADRLIGILICGEAHGSIVIPFDEIQNLLPNRP